MECPSAFTLPAWKALFQASLRPIHSSAITWMSLVASAASMVTVLPGIASVWQS